MPALIMTPAREQGPAIIGNEGGACGSGSGEAGSSTNILDGAVGGESGGGLG
jgi:hypothetical protein